MDTFRTPEQLHYAQSVGLNHIVNKYIRPALNDLTEALKNLEKDSSHGPVKIRVSVTDNIYFPIKNYSEKDLETTVTCDHCGLVFSVYGVFGRCPDCRELNAFLIFDKSLESIAKQLDIFSRTDVSKEILEQALGTVLSGLVAAFDGLGKELRKRKPNLFPSAPRNLFQNLAALNDGLNDLISKNHSDFASLNRLFLVRHLFEHSMGVIDEDFVRKMPSYADLLGRKYPLSVKELQEFMSQMAELGRLVKQHLNTRL